MNDSLSAALSITLLGAGIVFAAILFFVGLMAALTRLLPARSGAAEEAEPGSAATTELDEEAEDAALRTAAAAAVAAALALRRRAAAPAPAPRESLWRRAARLSGVR